MLLESFHLYHILYVIFWFFRNCLHPLMKGLGKVLPKEGFSIMAMSFAMKYVIWLIITSLLPPLTLTRTNAQTIRTNSNLHFYDYIWWPFFKCFPYPYDTLSQTSFLCIFTFSRLCHPRWRTYNICFSTILSVLGFVEVADILVCIYRFSEFI